MKKYIGNLIFILLIFGVSSCAKKNETNTKREVSSEINMEVVNNVLGEWVRKPDVNYPGEETITITLENNLIIFEDKTLQIVETTNNIVQTQTSEDKPFYYDFKVEGDELTVYPSYPVPKGDVGGDLAPMTFNR